MAHNADFRMIGIALSSAVGASVVMCERLQAS